MRAVIVKLGPRYPRAFRAVDRKLLWLEIDNVARLLDATPKDSPDRPRVLRRLADDHAELAAASEHDQLEAEALSDRVQRLDPVRAASLREAARDAARLVHYGRDRAIALYRELARDHRGYCHFPAQRRAADRGCGDETLHYLATELDQAGLRSEALAARRALVRGFPRSKYAPQTHVAIGEQLFEAARRSGSGREQAQRAYEAAMAGEAPELQAYARYKIGHVEWSRGRYEQAIEALAGAIELGMRPESRAWSAGLLEAARRDLVPLFAMARQPETALAFFQPLSGDRRGERRLALAWMHELGRRLMASGRHRASIVVHRELLLLHLDGDRCQYLAAIAHATAAADPNDRRGMLDALAELRAAAQARRQQQPEAGGTLRCSKTTAELLLHTAAAWHAEAAGPGGTGNRETLEAALRVYRWLAADAADPSIGRTKLERFAGEARAANLRYRVAALEHALERFPSCGRTFLSAFEADPGGPLAADALSASADCWLRAVASGPSLSEEDARTMRATLDRAVCALEPPEAIDRWTEVLLARADALLAAGDPAEAARAYQELTEEHPRSAAAASAKRRLRRALERLPAADR